MKKTVMTLALSLAGLMSAGAHAQSNYAGVNAAFLDYSERGVSGDASLNAVYGRIGTEFDENFAGEIRLGVGISDDNVRIGGTSVEVELDNFYGAYLRGGLQAAPNLYPYAIFGYTRAKLGYSGAGFRGSDSESDISFGVGLDIDIQNNLKVNVEYMNYLDKSGAEIDGVTVGLTARF